MTTTASDESADRINKLTEKLNVKVSEVEKIRAALKEEERKRRLQQDRKLRREKAKWKADLCKKLIRFYPLPVEEIESIIKESTSQSAAAE